jgi:Amidohydrolase family
MRTILCIISFFIFWLPSNSQTLTAITHVNIVDVKNEKIIPDKTVLIKADKIEQIGTNLKLPSNTKIIQGKDKFLIPGLWDMHYHDVDDDYSAEETNSTVIPLLIANGITGVRDMFGFNNTLKRRDSVRDGKLIGPESYVGAMVDGPTPVWPRAIPVSDTLRAVVVVDSLKNAGYDFIKVYSLLPREVYFAIAAESKKQNIPFEGHVPYSITAVEAALAGQKSIEHQNGMVLLCSSLPDSLKNEYASFLLKAYLKGGKEVADKNSAVINTFDTGQLNKSAKIFIQTGIWYCPTIIGMQSYLYKLKNVGEEIKNDSLTQYVTKNIKEFWGQIGATYANFSSENWNASLKLLELLNKIVKLLYDKKVNMLAGDDSENPFCYAGFSLHQELLKLVNCGLRDADVLKIATYNPAVFFGIEDKFGTVEEGKFANLVLLDANPLNKISSTKKINAVFLRGHYFDRNALDNLLARVKDYCKRH